MRGLSARVTLISVVVACAVVHARGLASPSDYFDNFGTDQQLVGAHPTMTYPAWHNDQGWPLLTTLLVELNRQQHPVPLYFGETLAQASENGCRRLDMAYTVDVASKLSS